jgi:tetratricopeptide (TPR) repeat protein
MLLPVIGLGQAGMQAIADRFTYLPSIGLAIVVAWGLAGISTLSGLWRTVATLGTAVLLSACLLVTRHQLGYWRDNVTLFSHALEVTREHNFTSYLMLGNTYWESGNLDKAAENYGSALHVIPTSKTVRYQLGHVLLLLKKFEEAGIQFSEIVRLGPEDAFAHKCLGYTMAAQGKYAEAEAEFATALQLNPGDAAMRNALAFVAQRAETAKTLASLYEALKIQPTPEVHTRIAAIETTQGKFQDAPGHYLAALRLNPDAPDVLNNLAWLLATCPDAQIRNGTQAVGYAERACERTNYKQIIMVGTLAAAYAEAGRFDDAIATAEKACALAERSGEKDLLQKNQELLSMYRAHRSYHEVAATNQPEPSVLDLSDYPGKPSSSIP